MLETLPIGESSSPAIPNIIERPQMESPSLESQESSKPQQLESKETSILLQQPSTGFEAPQAPASVPEQQEEPSSTPTTSIPSPNPHSKPCTLCGTPRDVLVRCQIDDSKTWHMLCTGACWKKVTGGGNVDGVSDNPYQYRYGGMWRNKHEVASAKLKGKAKMANARQPFEKATMHRRYGRSTRGKNKEGRVEMFNEYEEDGKGLENLGSDGDGDAELIVQPRN